MIPADADNQDVVWTSSDETVATVDAYGNVRYYSECTVTFTGSLKHGTTRTFTLTIVRDDCPYAQSIRPEHAEIRMTVGDVSPCSIVTEPDPAKLADYSYASDDPDVVAVGELGELTAAAPGETKVHISVQSMDENGERITLTTEVTVIVTAPAPPEPCDGGENCPGKAFTDTDRSKTSWYHEALDWAVTSGVTSGIDKTHFAPKAAATRAQAVTMLWRANGMPEPERTDNPFTDVSENAYCCKAVLWALENGITDGTTKTTFSPNAPCTRAHIVTFLYRCENGSAGQRNPFVDVPAGKWYTDAILWAVEAGVTTGVDATHFAPTSDCTRAQIVTFLWRQAAAQ